MVEVGDRIRRMMPSGMSQRELAERAAMTPDALSRALNGQRGLSPIEAAAIAKTLGADTHWLITGEPDPLAIAVAARHSWDRQRRVRVNDGRQEDQSILDQVVALYRAAYPHGPAASRTLPHDPAELSALLGVSFARGFAEVIETRLGVDVIRIPGLVTDYSIRIGGRGVIVLATQAAWFRSNWSLAHELAHLALGHHGMYESPGRTQQEERAADRFAADLLIPQDALESIVGLPDERSAAALVWDLGVSTEAIRNRLLSAHRTPVPEVAAALAKTTPRLLRGNPPAIARGEEMDPIITREQAGSARRFPVDLLSALQEQIDLGAASPERLAWALDVAVDDIDFPEPREETAQDIADRIGAGRPTLADWRAIIATRS